MEGLLSLKQETAPAGARGLRQVPERSEAASQVPRAPPEWAAPLSSSPHWVQEMMDPALPERGFVKRSRNLNFCVKFPDLTVLALNSFFKIVCVQIDLLSRGVVPEKATRWSSDSNPVQGLRVLMDREDWNPELQTLESYQGSESSQVVCSHREPYDRAVNSTHSVLGSLAICHSVTGKLGDGAGGGRAPRTFQGS